MKILQALESKWAELKKFVAFHADIEPVDITEGGYWYNTVDRHLHVHTDKDDTIAYMEDVRTHLSDKVSKTDTNQQNIVSRLRVTASGLPLEMVTTSPSVTNYAINTTRHIAQTDADMTNGFGVQENFGIQDNSGVANVISAIRHERDGNDTSGKVKIRVAKDGVLQEILTVYKDGVVDAQSDLSEAGIKLTDKYAPRTMTVTDESASSTLPIGNMPQPAAIQVLRNNVKQLQSSTTQNKLITVSTSAGWYRLGYVDLKVGTYHSVFGEIHYSSASFTGSFNFSVTRNNTPNTLNIYTFYALSCQNPPSVQWEVLGNGDIRVSWYAFFNVYHSAFATYNINSSASLANAYTHEYIGMTKPSNTELVNCLDRVNLTDASASSTLPIGDMTQPIAIQGLRNNVKQLQSTARQTGRLTSQNWNDFTESGIYNVADWSGVNGPTINGVQAYKWGFLVVESYQGTVIQTYYPHQSGMPCQRQSWEGGAFVGWSTSPRTGAGLAPTTSFVYQSFTLDRPNSNDIYFCV